uniref:Dynamin-type G domain-containing protein n=1 Tax=Macrostomum lignano TaxID=282301 RepID=A0A1I8IUC5_9PLAT
TNSDMPNLNSSNPQQPAQRLPGCTPISQMNRDLRQWICLDLNMERRAGNDWRMLADRLGFADSVPAWSGLASPMAKLLTEWSRSESATVRLLHRHLASPELRSPLLAKRLQQFYRALKPVFCRNCFSYETKSGQARDKSLSTPAEIGQAIRDAQEMTSSSGEISEKLIELHIEGADTPDLTLIDLPGIARLDIEARVNEKKKADKGNAVVIMHPKDYEFAAYNQLFDTDAYQQLDQPLQPTEMSSKKPEPAAESADFAPALSQAFKERLRPCLNALDSLRSHGLQREISLPAIAVVGDQSVGKSSVLEAISGVEFPRGLGIVTRCPLMLSMRGREDSGWTARIRYETKSGQARDKPLSTPAEIGQAIRDAQEEMTSSSGEISEKLIELHIEGADTPDLTLIDLPVSPANAGDIATVSKSLIMSYILKPEVLILVVIPGGDLSGSRSRPGVQAHPGVLTCPDLVNPGSETEVLAMMRNERLKLKKGFVTVRCRTPQQLKDNMGLREACKAEEEFFKLHPQFCALGDYQRGCKTLANKLSVELYQAVKERIPEMLKEIQIKRNDYMTMLEALGTGPPESEAEMKDLLVKMVEEFKEGILPTQPAELTGTRRPDCLGPADCTGRLWLMTSRDAPSLSRLRPHATQFLLSVTQKVDQTLRTLSDRVFGQYPSLNRHIKQEVELIKSRKYDDSKKQIMMILEQERIIFAQDRIYHSELEKPSNEKLQTKATLCRSRPTSRSRASLQRELAQQNSMTVLEGAEAYVRDTIPMAVVYNMLHGMSSGVSHRLGVLLMDPGQLYELLQEENPETGAKRRQLRQWLDRLMVAEQELSSF